MKIYYQNDIFNSDFNNLNTFLASFNSFADFKVCPKTSFSHILCHVEAIYLTFHESQLTGFSMMRFFTEMCLQADFHFSLNVNVTIDNYMNSISWEMILRNFLQQWVNLNIFRTTKPESTSKAALFWTDLQILLFLFFFCVFLKHKRDMRLTLLLIVFIFLQMHIDLPSHQKTYLKINFFNKIQFFTLVFIHTCDGLISFCFNYFIQSQNSNE